MKSAIELYVSQKVRELRNKKEWSYRYLGDCINVDSSFIAHVEDPKSGKCCKIYTRYIVYQHNRVLYISLRKQIRNKINILSDSLFFAFHLVSSLALGRIQNHFHLNNGFL